MNPYRKHVSEFARLYREGRDIPLGELSSPPALHLPPDAWKVLIFSPNPGDEAIAGGLALRLMRENRMRVTNVAVTHGSDRDRRSGRLGELRKSCDYIGFDLRRTAVDGLENVNVRNREENPGDWISSVETIVEILKEHRPEIVCFPHDTDQNSVHIGTHYLMVDALERLPRSISFYTVETEFWSPMASPNLMVEQSEADAGDLVAALSCHAGEVRLNPYHLRLPAWLMDNVRRGAALVGNRGSGTDVTFAVLYRLRRWEQGRFRNVLERGRFLAASENAGLLFPLL